MTENPLYSIDKGGRIVTTLRFLDGKVIELFLSGGIVSDRGETYSAIRRMGIGPSSIEYVSEAAFHTPEVMDDGGEIFVRVTTTEETAVAQLVNVILLFYGMNVGAYREQQKH